MENEGGSGTTDSHWERALFNNEIMTGSDLSGDFIFSIFTFMALYETGWYKLGNITPDTMEFGQFRGCQFFNNQCFGGTFPEYCTSGSSPTCSYGNTGYGSCVKDFLGNGCYFVRIYSNFDCRDVNEATSSNPLENQRLTSNMIAFDYNSICFNGSLSKDNGYLFPVSCHTQTCSADSSKMTVNVGGKNGYNFTCKSGNTMKVKPLYG